MWKRRQKTSGSERFEDATLLVLKMKEGAMNQGTGSFWKLEKARNSFFPRRKAVLLTPQF